MAPHSQITTSAKSPFIIRLQIDGITAHLHIEHPGVDCDSDVGNRLAAAVQYLDREDIRAKAVGGDVKINSIKLIGCLCRGCEWLGLCYWRLGWLIWCSGWLQGAREDIQ